MAGACSVICPRCRGIGGDSVTDDEAFDLYIARVDRGEQCPVCKHLDTMERTEAMGLPLFHCTLCGAEHFDSVTTPTQEA